MGSKIRRLHCSTMHQNRFLRFIFYKYLGSVLRLLSEGEELAESRNLPQKENKSIEFSRISHLSRVFGTDIHRIQRDFAQEQRVDQHPHRQRRRRHPRRRRAGREQRQEPRRLSSRGRDSRARAFARRFSAASAAEDCAPSAVGDTLPAAQVQVRLLASQSPTQRPVDHLLLQLPTCQGTLKIVHALPWAALLSV